MGERMILDSSTAALAHKRQTRAMSEAATKAPSSANSALAIAPCGHAAGKGKFRAVDLPAGIKIDCAKCVENFKMQADTLFDLFQRTFAEQDLERAAPPNSVVQAPEGAININAPTNEAPVRRTTAKKGRPLQRQRAKGRFMPKPAPVASYAGIAEEGMEGNTPLAKAEREITPIGNLVDTTADAKELSQVAEAAPMSLLVEEQAPLPQSIEEDKQESMMHDSNVGTSTQEMAVVPTREQAIEFAEKKDVDPESADQNTAGGLIEPPAAKRRGRPPRAKVPPVMGPGVGSTQPGVNSGLPEQIIASGSKRKGSATAEPPAKRQKAPDVKVEPPVPQPKRRPGRPRKQRPGDNSQPMLVAGTTQPAVEPTASTSTTVPESRATGSTEHPKSGPLLPYSSAEGKLPAMPIAPTTRLEAPLAEPEKRRRGRPPKVAVEKSLPIAPVPIQPKPAPKGESVAAASPAVVNALPVPAAEPKKRGRPRKPQITLDRSPVVAPMLLPSVPAASSSVAGTSVSQEPPLKRRKINLIVRNPAEKAEVKENTAPSSSTTADGVNAPIPANADQTLAQSLTLAATNAASSASATGATARGGSSARARGRGRGRGRRSTPAGIARRRANAPEPQDNVDTEMTDA